MYYITQIYEINQIKKLMFYYVKIIFMTWNTRRIFKKLAISDWLSVYNKKKHLVKKLQSIQIFKNIFFNYCDTDANCVTNKGRKAKGTRLTFLSII